MRITLHPYPAQAGFGRPDALYASGAKFLKSPSDMRRRPTKRGEHARTVLQDRVRRCCGNQTSRSSERPQDRCSGLSVGGDGSEKLPSSSREISEGLHSSTDVADHLARDMCAFSDEVTEPAHVDVCITWSQKFLRLG